MEMKGVNTHLSKPLGDTEGELLGEKAEQLVHHPEEDGGDYSAGLKRD